MVIPFYIMGLVGVIITEEIIEIVKLASKYPTIKRVGVFGSFARGDNGAASDIDLLYDYDEESENSTDEILNYVDEIDELIKKIANVNKIDYVCYKGVIRSGNEEFRQAVLNEVVWVYTSE